MRVFFCAAVFLVSVALAVGQACVQEGNCVRGDECVCPSLVSPIPVAETPQFITISLNDAITDLNYVNYYSLLLDNRVNPDSYPISATFYVPHEYTDYSRVNDLYNRGIEIAVHSISKNPLSDYWQTAEVDTLVEEFEGQRTIISTFANIPIGDVVGARVPNMELAGDALIEAYIQSGIEFDATWTLRSLNRSFPFTLDFTNNLECSIGTCPTQSFPGIWVAPIINLEGPVSECNNVQGCGVGGTAEEISDWLYEQFLSVYGTNRAPLNLILSAAWFLTYEEALDGFTNFIDRVLLETNDVFFVSNGQVVQWMKNPVPSDEVSSNPGSRDAPCVKVSCAIQKEEEYRYMASCIECPAVFPWLGNPLGEAAEEEEEEEE